MTVFKINARTGEGVNSLKKALFQDQFIPHYPFGSENDHTHESHYDSIAKLLIFSASHQEGLQ